MIIQVDQEGRSAIQQLCDIALKSAGVQNLNPVNTILRSVMLLPIPEDVKQETNRPKSPEKEDKTESQAKVEKPEELEEEKPKEEVVEEKLEVVE